MRHEVFPLSGILTRSAGEWTVIDPPPGDSAAYEIGDGQIVLFEGAVEDAARQGEHLLISITGGGSLTVPAGA
jgi:hypothetical protein